MGAVENIDRCSRQPLVTEERGGVGQRGTRRSALDAVLRSLCPAHRSLLYQILKLAHQENLLLFLNHKPVGPTESHCCHCSASPQDNITPHSVLYVKCKAHNCSLFCPSTDCNHQSHCGLRYHSGDSKSTCSIHQQPFKDCNIDAQQGSSCGCMQRFRMENYSALGSKKLHCNSCQNLAAVSSFTSVPLLSQPSTCTSSRLCSSVRYKQQNSCSCCSHHACLPQVNTEDFRDRDGFTAVNREQSPSPPRLSPIPSDIGKKNNEKPPSLFHHRQGEEADLINKNRPVTANHVTAGMDTARETELPCKTAGISQTEQTPNGTSLQDVMNRFSQKLENITPLEKDPTLVSTAIYVSEKEHPSTSQNLPFHADSHLTEIITTVLHTGNASDYNLNELFSHHDNREPKSPNTRARRRQEIQIAIATPADSASARRHTLDIKRKFAMLDPSCNRRKVPQAKKARLNEGKVSITTPSTSSDTHLHKKMCKSKADVDFEPVEDHKIMEGALNTPSVGHEREEFKKNKRAIVTEELVKKNMREREKSLRQNKVANVKHLPEQQNTNRPRKIGPKDDPVQMELAAISANKSPCKKGCKSRNPLSNGSREDTDNTPEKASLSHIREGQKCQSNKSRAKRRSMRSIVPPQRFNSYVTWHAPIFHVSHKDADADDTQPKTKNDVPQSPCESARKLDTLQIESSYTASKDLRHVFVQTMVKKEENSEKHSPEKERNGSDFGGHRRLRSSTKKLQVSKVPQSPLDNDTNIQPTCAASSSSPRVNYISPIKLMFVSQVTDKEGVKYSLKSAWSSSGTQAEESFDPCKESSWSGTPQKCKSRSKEHAATPPLLVPTKSVRSCTLPASSPAKSTSSPAKSASSPAKTTSPPAKLVSSPAKSTSSPASSPAKSTSSPAKSTSSPAKSTSSPTKSTSSPTKSPSSPTKSPSSPRSVSLSPKNSSRRSRNSTPTKHLSEHESRRSPCNLPCETTPPKRRPGRPKKLGPQPEKRVKRPIGRPPKQKTEEAVVKSKSLIEKGNSAPDEDNVAKNLKITVLYGRSRRNKRMVSEGCDPLETDFGDACKAVAVKRNLATLLDCSKSTSGQIKTALQELNVVNFAKELVSQSSSNIKCQKTTESVPMRKPGRPAKVKISGISVTVTTVSPRQRKIQINKDTPRSAEMQLPKKALLPEFKSVKDPGTVSCLLTSESNQTEEEMGTKTDNKSELPSQPVAVRHSMRERKPSIHLLHAVATSSSRSYSCSSALLRRSKKLLLNKASNERKQEQQSGVSREKRQLHEQERKSITQDLSQVARVSLDSIFRPKEMVRWWTPSVEEKTMNQELARRIRVISDTWVSDTAENQGRETAFSCKLDTEGSNSPTGKAKKSSAVRTLFDCSPNKPRSCSMQQICSWFMQSTETQSLAIVKKASSRNPYELMHFPRSANIKSVCYSPQAERLRKHIKKFAKTVPKSPLQHQQAQQQLRKKKNSCQRQLFVSRFSVGKRNRGIMWWRWTLSGRFWAALMRARMRFLTRKQRERWQKKQRNKKIKKVKEASCSNGPVVTGLKPNRKALHRSTKTHISNCVRNSSPTPSGDQTQEHVEEQKEQKELCSKAWSPETLKECRVFLRKINSPGNESAEEWDSCTVTLDEGSPSTYLFAGEEQEMEGIVKAVKNKRSSMNKRTASREPTNPGPKSAQNHDAVPVRRQMGKRKHPEVVPPELPQQPPAKMLRQSRMRGLSGPRWCDFVFEN